MKLGLWKWPLSGGLLLVLLAAFKPELTGRLLGFGPAFPIEKSTLIFGSTIGFKPIYWLDNDRALFPGYAVTPIHSDNTKQQYSVTPPGVYVWNIKTNTYERHADLQAPLWFMCFNEGFIAYSIAGGDGADDQLTVMAGEFGQEKLLSPDILWRKNPELRRCDVLPQRDLSPDQTNYAFTLRPGDGKIIVTSPAKPTYLFNVEKQNNNIILINQNNNSIELPILAKEVWHSDNIKYSAFSNKYTIIQNLSRDNDITYQKPRSGIAPVPVYAISPDGTVETYEIPPGIWYPTAVFLTRRGLFWVSNEAPHAAWHMAGGFLLHEGKVTRLFKGLVDAASVSPDGCRIAYQTSDRGTSSTAYVSAIDLCEAPDAKPH
jgi:hypothetical protein